MKWCWHRWDVYKQVITTDSLDDIKRTVRICRKCGETRVKDKVY